MNKPQAPPKRYHIGNLVLHPDFGRMTKELLAKAGNKSLKLSSIAKRMNPPVPVTTIQRYYQERLPNAIRKRVGPDGKVIGEPHHSVEEFQNDIIDTVTGDYIVDTLNRKDRRMELAMQGAFTKEKWDSLARLNASNTKDLELRAKLEGRLDSKPQIDASQKTFFLVVPKQEMEKHAITVDVTPAIEAPAQV